MFMSSALALVCSATASRRHRRWAMRCRGRRGPASELAAGVAGAEGGRAVPGLGDAAW